MEHLALQAFFLIPFLESLLPLRDLVAPTPAPRISLILNLHTEVSPHPHPGLLHINQMVVSIMIYLNLDVPCLLNFAVISLF